jgi:hypothetical protein
MPTLNGLAILESEPDQCLSDNYPYILIYRSHICLHRIALRSLTIGTIREISGLFLIYLNACEPARPRNLRLPVTERFWRLH